MNAIVGSLLVVLFVLYFVLIILMVVAFYKLAKKAGLNRIAWFAFVPVLSTILQLRMIQKSGWWTLILLVPVANIVFAIIWQVKLLNAFGKHGANVLFMLFLPPVYTIQWVVWGFSNKTVYQLRENIAANTQVYTAS